MAVPSRRGLLCVVAALAATACLAPTLPLPPPTEPSVSSPDEQGIVHVSGRVRANSWAFAMNQRSNAGTFQGTAADGRYDMEIPAEVGDGIALWYELDGDVSESVVVLVPPADP